MNVYNTDQVEHLLRLLCCVSLAVTLSVRLVSYLENLFEENGHHQLMTFVFDLYERSHIQVARSEVFDHNLAEAVSRPRMSG